jgi:hypothetical protein
MPARRVAAMMPGFGGTPPRPPGYQPPQLPSVAPGSSSGLFRGRLVIVQGTGPNSGLFVYAGVPALGNPPIFWATSASFDPFGNALPSTAGVAGTGTFQAGNTIINANGIFIYSAAPAAGNLIVSDAAAAGTDAFGNVYVQGQAIYTRPGDGNTYVQTSGIVPGTSVTGLWVQNQTSPVNLPPYISGDSVTTAGTELFLSSGRATAPAVDSSIHLQDSVLSAVTNGLISLPCGKILFGLSGAGVWDDSKPELDLPASGGPFIPGESFHAVSLGTNLSGTIRVKKLPWNAIWLDINVSDSSATAAGITCGSLPDASYYPTAQRHFPLALNGSPSVLGTVNARVTIPTSGAISITTVTTTGAPVAYSCSVMYPTN